MGQGFQINHFWNFSAFASAICKDGGRQYKYHNIAQNYMTVLLMNLDSLEDSDINQ